MSLKEVQVLLSRYVRDQDFRARCRDGGTELAGQPGLSAADRGFLADIDLDELDRIAEHVLTERLGRTSGVFGLLLEHLARFIDVGECYRQFDRQWTGGWWQRRAEVRRFEAFVLDLVVTERLPEYLVDVSRLCAQVTIIAETPKVWPEGGGNAPMPDRVRGGDVITLRAPFDVLRLRHDVLRLMDEPEGYGSAPVPVPTAVLIQRDWRQHKRSRLFRLGDEPVLDALTHGPATIFDLGGRLPHVPYAALLTAVAELCAEQIVQLTVAPELAGGSTPVSTSWTRG